MGNSIFINAVINGHENSSFEIETLTMSKENDISLKQKYGQLALVAGASEGIGAAFASYLAASGIDLILFARRKEPLEEFASLLRDEYHVQVHCVFCDLSDIHALVQIQEIVAGKEIYIMVYNAALSYIGPFEENSVEKNNAMATANMITPMNLIHILARPMLARRRGAIILMSSLAGLRGSGFLAMYAATKAFNRILAESLWYEWKNKGIDVIACCAGATATPNFIKTNPEKKNFFAPKVQRPEEVVQECFKHLGKRPSFISGSGNKVASFIMQHLLPRKMAINIMGDTTRKMYRL
jgi:short-subunit dehydrogenase